VPFTVTTGFLTPEYPSPQLTLTGGGHVTFTLVRHFDYNGWAITHSSFDFGGGRPD
jgi:hypothetical protein